MARKKSVNSQNLPSHASDKSLGDQEDREVKIMNSMANVSVILMGVMMGAFTDVMSKAAGVIASGMAQALGGEEAGTKLNGEIMESLPDVDSKMKAVIFDIRKDVYAQMGRMRKQMKPLLSDPLFDVGPKIIDNYDFKLPKLSRELDDDSLARYSKLLANEDPGFVEMFKKLTEWINSLPKPPEKTGKKNKSNAAANSDNQRSNLE
jgi:hypothetical protein